MNISYLFPLFKPILRRITAARWFGFMAFTPEKLDRSDIMASSPAGRADPSE